MTPEERAEVEGIKKDVLVAERPETIMFSAEKWRSDTCLLLNILAEAEGERDRLAEWKASALALLTRYDDLAETFPGAIGSSKVENLENGVTELRLRSEAMRGALGSCPIDHLFWRNGGTCCIAKAKERKGLL